MSNQTQSSGGYATGGGGGTLNSVVGGRNITIDNTDPSNPIINSSADDIIVVANYSSLPAVGTVAGQFYWCSASQGTKWLPGALGGTYYSAGMYYSNGVTWEFLDVPYQATQATVNTGTNTDQFVTPATLANYTGLTGKVASVSGTVNRITSTGGTTPIIDISASYIGQSSITTLGTITTGVWNGTTISVANGGTGGTSASITLFNNITGYSASGATGTTSTNLVFSTSPSITTPTFVTNATVPLLIGGTGTTSTLTFRTTSNSGGTTGADFIWQSGNNGSIELMRLLNGGALLIGTSTLNGSEMLGIRKDQNSNTYFVVDNTNTGTSAASGFALTNDTSTIQFIKAGVNYTLGGVGGLFAPNFGILYESGSSGLNIGCGNASAVIQFYTGGFSTSNLRWKIDNSGNLNATDAINIIVGTSTGSKIGTSTSQKLGFWNATPVVQQVLATGAFHVVDDVISFLQTIGLCKQS